MKVSIITPVYNASHFLEKTAESVFNQTYSDWEWILVDDCSTDNSWDMLQELKNRDCRVRIYKNSVNVKQGKTRNFAIEKASGRFIAFLDSDDIWHNDKLKIQIKFMLDNNYYFTHTSCGYLDEQGNKIKSTFRVSPIVNYQHLLKSTEILCLTAVYDSEKIGKYYMPEYDTREDYVLWLSILKNGINCYGIDKELAYYRLVKGSHSSKKARLILMHVTLLKKTQGLNTIQALYYTMHWAVRGFVKYYIK